VSRSDKRYDETFFGQTLSWIPTRCGKRRLRNGEQSLQNLITLQA